MRKRELERAMMLDEKVRALDPRTNTYGEECVIRRVYKYKVAPGKCAVGAELRGYNSVYHECSKYIKPSKEVAANEV